MSGDAVRSEAPDLPSVAVVVANDRTKELTAEAVRSVTDDPLVQVVVVENGSGFGRGAKLGVSASHASPEFLLHSDERKGASRLQLRCAGVLGMAQVGLERLRAGGTRSG